MEIRTCERCRARMRRVVYGLPTEEDFKNDDGYTEYAGCMVTFPRKSWVCFECGHSILENEG